MAGRDERVTAWLTDVCGIDLSEGAVRRVEIVIEPNGCVELNVYRFCPDNVFDVPGKEADRDDRT